MNGSPATVSGDNTYRQCATPTAIGTYTFVASYDGDSPNTLGASGSCPPAAGDGDEQVIVTGTAATLDRAGLAAERHGHLTGRHEPTGTLTFALHR